MNESEADPGYLNILTNLVPAAHNCILKNETKISKTLLKACIQCCGSGSAKMTHKNRKKLINFMF
jgi:hypothetical protein